MNLHGLLGVVAMMRGPGEIGGWKLWSRLDPTRFWAANGESWMERSGKSFREASRRS